MKYKAIRVTVVLMCLGVLLAAAACQKPPYEAKIAMGDYFYTPNDLTVPAGPVRFLLSNVGQNPHRLAISGEGVKISAKNVGVGKEGVLEVDLAPGTYKLSCTLGDHEKRGSVGKLTVK